MSTAEQASIQYPLPFLQQALRDNENQAFKVSEHSIEAEQVLLALGFDPYHIPKPVSSEEGKEERDEIARTFVEVYAANLPRWDRYQAREALKVLGHLAIVSDFPDDLLVEACEQYDRVMLEKFGELGPLRFIVPEHFRKDQLRRRDILTQARNLPQQLSLT